MKERVCTENAQRGAECKGWVVSDAISGPQGTHVLAAALFQLRLGRTVARLHLLAQALPAAQERG